MHSRTLHSWFVALVFISTENVVYCQVCSSSPCGNGGACLELQDTFLCLCEDGFIGRRCELAGMAMVCEHNTCGNGGTCTSSFGVIACDCLPEYTGSRCDTLVEEDPCSSSPCENGGSCQSSEDGFTCDCAEGYTGSQCTVKEDPCLSNPCENGGSCQSIDDGYTCDCAEGYTGGTCNVEENPCSSNPCENGGSCQIIDDGYTCNCAEGYTGSKCEEKEDPCLSNPCQNGGSCRRNNSTFTCQCSEGYTGGKCETASLATKSTVEETTPTEFYLTTESTGGLPTVWKTIIALCAFIPVIVILCCGYLYKFRYQVRKRGMDARIPVENRPASYNVDKDLTFRRFLLKGLQFGGRGGSKVEPISYQNKAVDKEIDVNDNKLQDENDVP